MKRGRLFCADPREKWVNELMLKVETKKSKKVRISNITTGFIYLFTDFIRLPETNIFVLQHMKGKKKLGG